MQRVFSLSDSQNGWWKSGAAEEENTRDHSLHEALFFCSNERHYGVCSSSVGVISTDFPSASNPKCGFSVIS